MLYPGSPTLLQKVLPRFKWQQSVSRPFLLIGDLLLYPSLHILVDQTLLCYLEVSADTIRCDIEALYPTSDEKLPDPHQARPGNSEKFVLKLVSCHWASTMQQRCEKRLNYEALYSHSSYFTAPCLLHGPILSCAASDWLSTGTPIAATA